MTLENNNDIETVDTAPTAITQVESMKQDSDSVNNSSTIDSATHDTQDNTNSDNDDAVVENNGSNGNNMSDNDNQNNTTITTTTTATITTPTTTPTPTTTTTTTTTPAATEQADGANPIYISSDESMDEQFISEDSDMEDSLDESEQDGEIQEEEFSNELMLFYLEEIMRYNGKLGDAIEDTQNNLMEDMRGLRQFYEYIKKTLKTVKKFPMLDDSQRVQASKSNHLL
jgi:hypothetical protein